MRYSDATGRGVLDETAEAALLTGLAYFGLAEYSELHHQSMGATVQHAIQSAAGKLSAISKKWVDSPEATKAYDKYDAIRGEPVPPGLDECERLKWLRARQKRLLKAKTLRDAEFDPNRHADDIQQIRAAISNYTNKIKKACGPKCLQN